MVILQGLIGRRHSTGPSGAEGGPGASSGFRSMEWSRAGARIPGARPMPSFGGLGSMLVFPHRTPMWVVLLDWLEVLGRALGALGLRRSLCRRTFSRPGPGLGVRGCAVHQPFHLAQVEANQSCDVLGEAVGGAPGGKLSAVYVMAVRVMPFSSSFALCSWNSSSERENRLRL